MEFDIREIEIRYLRPNSGEVEGLPRNPRKISKKNLGKLKKSVQDAPEMLLLRELIVVPHGDQFVVIAGNQRLEAAKAVGMSALPCKVLPSDTDPAKLREYARKDNLPFGEDDWEVIASDWDMAELEEWGMTVPEKWKDNPTAEEDDFDADSAKETVCKKGDIWQLGDHRLMCGDSTEAASVALLMDGEKADMVFTDPPYGMKKERDGVLNDNLNFDDLLEFNKQWISLAFANLKDNGSWYCWGIDEPLMDIYANILKPMQKRNEITFRNLITWDKGNGQGQLSKEFRMYPIADEKCLFVVFGTTDFVSGRDNNKWVKPIVDILQQKARDRGYTEKDLRVIAGLRANGPDHFLDTRVFNMPRKEYYDLWFDDGEYDQLLDLYERLKVDHLSERCYFDNTHDNMNNVWHFDRVEKNERENTGGHATPKPIALCSRAIKSSSREGESVLDLFGGSGSTMIACEQLGRKCYMMELDPHYCDVIIARWEKLTGKKATKIN